MEKPDYVTDEHLKFLDDLRELGITNMFGARQYLMEAFDITDSRRAGKILTYWMTAFEAGK